MVDKILIANVAALKGKYGAKGFRQVERAIKALIAADRASGLTTEVVDISSRPEMKKYKAVPVSSPSSERQNKRAVDAVYTVLRPDYLVLLDGPDIIPHLLLNNPTPKDKDRDVPSDLPYASETRFNTRDVKAYAAVTRVVGRIPGITGADDPSFLVSQLGISARFRSRKRDDYLSNFTISAYSWRKSTERSAENIFGRKAIKVCPPTSSPNTRKMLAPRCHLINCHGDTVDPKFYGQRGRNYPVSMTSDDVARGAARDTIVAAECCFGAQLFDPTWVEGRWPICNAYLEAGAIAFFGSTTIAYGPAIGNGSADLITQYFLINALNGASTGRSCLQAQQKFVHGQRMEDPVNLKTLAQFILLGDPSLQPVRRETVPSAGASEIMDAREARKTRRLALFASGKAAADCSGFPGQKVRTSTNLRQIALRIARQRGLRVGPDAVEAYHVVGGDEYRRGMDMRGVAQKVVVVTHRTENETSRPPKVPPIRILVAHVQNDRLTEIVDYVRR
jgi:hypothetical protein